MEDKRASDNLILKCTQEIKRDQRTEESPMGLQDKKTGNLGLHMTEKLSRHPGEVSGWAWE